MSIRVNFSICLRIFFIDEHILNEHTMFIIESEELVQAGRLWSLLPKKRRKVGKVTKYAALGSNFRVELKNIN